MKDPRDQQYPRDTRSIYDYRRSEEYHDILRRYPSFREAEKIYNANNTNVVLEEGKLGVIFAFSKRPSAKYNLNSIPSTKGLPGDYIGRDMSTVLAPTINVIMDIMCDIKRQYMYRLSTIYQQRKHVPWNDYAFSEVLVIYVKGNGDTRRATIIDVWGIKGRLDYIVNSLQDDKLKERYYGIDFSYPMEYALDIDNSNCISNEYFNGSLCYAAQNQKDYDDIGPKFIQHMLDDLYAEYPYWVRYQSVFYIYYGQDRIPMPFLSVADLYKENHKRMEAKKKPRVAKDRMPRIYEVMIRFDDDAPIVDDYNTFVGTEEGLENCEVFDGCDVERVKGAIDDAQRLSDFLDGSFANTIWYHQYFVQGLTPVQVDTYNKILIPIIDERCKSLLYYIFGYKDEMRDAEKKANIMWKKYKEECSDIMSGTRFDPTDKLSLNVHREIIR